MFALKHGARHHAFDSEKAPYPMSYDRHVLELQNLDRAVFQYLKGSVSFVDFKDGVPERSLDLGCGSGAWAIDAAKEWPDCHFVGIDLVNVQLPTYMLPESIAKRISWVHGNFLTTKLPFDDDEFDHVHIASIARGVPENKWNVLFDEVNRVLRPGGIVEVHEQDIIFPTLPRWFTAPLRVRTRRADSIYRPNGPPPPVHNDTRNQPAHDHALLESLFNSVFESRFISRRPTAVLPIYFTPYFRQVISSPVINFPMPSLPPLPPLPEQLITPDPLTANLEASEEDFLNGLHNGSSSIRTRPASLSVSSTASAASTAASTNPSLLSAGHITPSASDTIASKASVSMTTLNSQSSTSSDKENGSRRSRFVDGNAAADSTSLGGFSHARLLMPVESMMQLNEERTLAMHLYHSYQSVLACQESMWEVLKDLILNKKEELVALGWDDDEELEELQSRKKFELLVDRYRTDMQARVSLWCSLTEMGWTLPPREPLSKAELLEEERVHQAMLEGRRHAVEEDFEQVCRSMRVMVGFKGSS
ncbi:hypothetical protein PLICRDRAFT_99692 [Plicaturopsis crispa FD-325 SS-3]|nr:hypothetical protein PLICRDRAFT_99692 [Plicaturopsis crispa FD-325 SS-3]